MDSAHYLEVYDIELIESWTPKEFRLLVKGSQLRNIDKYEYMAKSAMAYAYANNGGKKAKEKKIFDAEKQRKLLDESYRTKVQKKKERLLKMNEVFKGFNPMQNFIPKGGK